MGIATWLAAGTAAFLIGRAIRLRRSGWPAELIVALFGSFLAGLAATAMDFGGLREPDWRAGVFALLVGFAVVAVVRLTRRES